MLKWTIQELMKHDQEPLHFSTTLDVKADLQDRDPEVLDVSPIQVNGDIVYDRGDFLVSVNLKGTLVVPSTRSLTPVTLPQDFTFSEIYLTDNGHADQYEDGDRVAPGPRHVGAAGRPLADGARLLWLLATRLHQRDVAMVDRVRPRRLGVRPPP